MTESRFIQIESMLSELIRIVGNTNAAVEGLRDDVAILKKDVAELKIDVAVLKNDVNILRNDVAELKIITRNKQIDIEQIKEGQIRLETAMTGVKEDMKSLYEITGEHDVASRSLRRRPV